MLTRRWGAAGVLLFGLGIAVGGVAAEGGAPPLRGGAAITPEFAARLYAQIAPLRAGDGCRLVVFDTGRNRITIGLKSAAGAEHQMEIAAASAAPGLRTAGDWALVVPPELERDCGATVAAIAQQLASSGSPARPGAAFALIPSTYRLLQGTFVLLVLGTAWILWREARAARPPAGAVLMLVLVWAAALALRLQLSPRTFLHEYYHIAETISGYLYGDLGPAYGKTGPAMFRLAGALLGRPDDVHVIFLVNAVFASLAIPAVALFDLALLHRWPRAICAAVLLCVLPQHLRFSAAEDLFVQALTFGLWSLGLFALYLRTRRLEDALLAAVATALAMQARPEMLFLPIFLVALVLLVDPRDWRLLIGGRTLLALLLLGVLLIPRAYELREALQHPPSTAVPFNVRRYLDNLLLFDSTVTPLVYQWVLAVGALWTLWRKPGLLLWVGLLYLGFTTFSFKLFDNPPYHVRTQLVPSSFSVLIAAGAAAAWMEAWGRRSGWAMMLGAVALAIVSGQVLASSREFVTELRDQQLEWAFLERTVPRLPDSGTLLAAVDVGGRTNLDAFPDYLLQQAGKTYQLFDVRSAARGELEWPAPGPDVLFYQGMFCYFAFEDEPLPEPMSAPCLAVYDRYVLEPLAVEDLAVPGYSWITYTGDGDGPFRIGFYRVAARR